MRKINIAINGFGRIGRITMRRLLTMDNINVVAINDLTDSKTLAHLFKYDTAHGKFSGNIEAGEGYIQINNNKIPVSAIGTIEDLPWAKYNVDVVIESTGIKRFLTEEYAKKHLVAGAKRVILSAPSDSNDVKTIVLGVNEYSLTSDDKIISNASCTTNCLTPMLKVMDEAFGIERAFMSTIHSYTADQRLQDAPHPDLRRARAAAMSIIPTTTGANKAVSQVMPHLNGKIEGSSYRVPVIDGSLTELTMILNRDASADEINAAFEKASKTDLIDIIEYTDEPLVSVDIRSNPYSCIFDSLLTQSTGNFVKIVGWYDNEAGYSNRLAELALIFGNK